MGFYDLPKDERSLLVKKIQADLEKEIISGKLNTTISYFSDEDTYIRKAAYEGIGKIYLSDKSLLPKIYATFNSLFTSDNFRIRQTVLNAAGEIGKTNFEAVEKLFDTGLFDEHHAPRNAVIGAVKKMGEKNPIPVLQWANKYLHHPDKEVRREICHGIELRGRKFPQDILPMLKELEFDKTARVRNTLVHVLGQISYKKGCLPIVIEHLKTWKNKELVSKALEDIIDVHDRYKNFSVLSQKQAIAYISLHEKELM